MLLAGIAAEPQEGWSRRPHEHLHFPRLTRAEHDKHRGWVEQENLGSSAMSS